MFIGTDADRITHYTDRRGPDECWPWTGHSMKTGHGQMYSQHHKKAVTPYRRLYEITNNVELTRFELVDHTCRNPCCMNPGHLQQATQKTNQENLKGARANSKTGVRGVTPWKNGRFRASVNHNQTHYHVGLFDTVEDAEAAVIAKRNELFTNNLKDRGL